MSANGRRGAPIGTPSRSPAKASKGRTCGHPGCLTILSVYNHLDVCGVHEPSVTRPALYHGPKSNRTAASR